MKGSVKMGYSNLAYDVWEDELNEQKKETKKVNAKKTKKNFKPIVYVLILSVAAYYMISKNVVLYETNQEIKDKQQQITNLETYISQRTFELEQSVDLATIEQEASQRLNMQRPQSYQIEYVSVARADVTEVTANDVEGVKNKVGKAAKGLKRNIIGIFSLNGK